MKYKLLLLVAVLLLSNQEIFGQNIFIKGRVIDYETEKPMPGSNILNGMNGIVIGKDGTFENEMRLEDHEFEVSFIGYYTIKFINIPNEKKCLDFKDIKIVRNVFEYMEPREDVDVTRCEESDEKLKKNVLKKYRIQILGQELKPYFEGKYLVFDFSSDGNR